MVVSAIIGSGISLIPKFKDDIVKYAVLLKDESDNFFKKGINLYLDKQLKKFYQTKTFIFRDKAIKFYEGFFPVRLKQRNVSINTENILESLFDDTNYATIIGSAGSGKTMLMKHIFIQSYYTLFKIPIVIELRYLNEFKGSILEYIYQVILENKISPSKRILERVLNSGKFIFLFDGYDEIYSEGKQKRTEEIERFVDMYSENFYLITSRPGAEAETLQRFDNFYVENLNKNEINGFVKQQLNLMKETILANKLIDVINKKENAHYVQYISNPLLLSMFILTFNQFPDLPRLRIKFYYNVFDTLVTRHDSLSKRGGFQHERKTGLQNEIIENILKWFSYVSLFNGIYSFDKEYLVDTLKLIKDKLNLQFDIDFLIQDLTVAVSLIVIDGNEYKFPHKSFQEYFCASLIRDLDVESKKKVYTLKFPNFLLRTQEAENFLNLCIEFDKHNIYQHLFIPKLKKILNALNAEDGFQLVKQFYELTAFQITISIINDTNDFGYARGVSDTNKIIEFLNLSRYFWDFYDVDYLKTLSLEDIEELVFNGVLSADKYGSDEDVEYILRFNDIKKEGIRELIEKGKLIEQVKKFVEKIKAKIMELQNEIANEKDQTRSLLNF